MARDVNRYEAVILNKMVDIRRGEHDGNIEQAMHEVWLLLGIVVDFREQPTSEPLESGCGKMVVSE